MIVAGFFALVLAVIATTIPTPNAIAAAGINKQISFQGKVVNGNGTNVTNGNYNFVFSIYTQQAPGGAAVWTESKSLTVTDGIFQTNLGSATSLPGSVDFNSDNIFLGINFNSDGEMTPRIQFTSAAYAFNSDKLGGLSASAFGQLSPASAQTGFLNVTGNVTSGATVAAATSVQAPLLDTASAVALSIGTTTASSVTVGRATSSNTVTLQGSNASTWTVTGASGTTTLGFANPTATNTITFPNAGGTVCTTVASTCNATYQAYSAGGYIAKNAADTSSASTLGALLGLTNSNTGAAGVLSLTNAGTNSALSVVQSANPTAGQALIVANNTNGTPSGNLIDLQIGGVSQLAVDAAGNITQVGGSATTATINGQRISAAANFTGTVTAATSLLAPLLDTASAGVLAIGTTNATGINLNKNTVVAAGNTLTAGKVIGGTGITDVLSLQGTSGNGTATSPAIQALVGNAGATTAMTILNNGNVGIGTASPQAALQVGSGQIFVPNGTAAAPSYSFTNSPGTGIYALSASEVALSVQGSRAMDWTYQSVTFGANNIKIDNHLTAANADTISSWVTGTGMMPFIQFRNDSVANASVLLPTGNVGIAVSVPASKLEVMQGTGSTWNTTLKSDPNTAYGLKLQVGDGGAEDIPLQISNYANSTNYLTMLGNGNLGIGTSSPANKLSVNTLTTADNLAQAAISTNGTANKGLVIQGVAGQTASLFEAQSSTGAAAIRIDNNGNFVSTLTAKFGTATTFSGNTSLSVQPYDSTRPAVVVRGVAGQTANVFQIWNAAGTDVQSAFSPNGNQLILGNNTASGTSAGSIRFADGTSDGFYSTLQSSVITANQIITIPDTAGAGGTICLQSSSACGFAVGTAGSYIQNQSAAAQATSNFWISGTGRADTSLQAPLFDTASAGALAVGTTNATAINLNQNTVLLGDKSLTISGSGTRPASPTEGMIYFDTGTHQLITYSNGKWQADRNTSTKIVAPTTAKDGADYVTDGTDDQVEINAALSASTGGKVYLAEGTYTITGSISIPNNTTLAGAGIGTVIKLANSHNVALSALVMTDTTTGTGVVIRDLKLDGNKANQSAGSQNGIVLSGMGGSSGATARKGAQLLNIVSTDWRTDALFMTGSSNNVISGSTFANANTGIEILGGSYNSFNGNYIQGNVTYGVYSSAGSNSYTSNYVEGNTYGFMILTAGNNTITSNVITGTASTGNGIYISTSNSNLVSSNRIMNIGGATTNEAIYLTVADKNTIVDNHITDTAASSTNYAIRIADNTSDNNYLSNNVFSSNPGTGSINDAGTGTVFANQARTENGGQLLVRTTDNASAFSIQGSNKVNIFNVDSANGEVEIGNYNSGTNPVAGKLVVANANNAFNVTLQSVANPTGDRTVLLPDEGGTLCIQGSVNCGFAVGTAGSYIQNQSAAAQATSNFWISGTGKADVSILSPLVDTPSAVALNIGTGTASAVNIGRNSTNFTLQGVSGAGNSSIKASSGGFTTSVEFANPSANQTITFPNAAGTVCTNTSSTCSSAYIVNGTALQTANLNIASAAIGSISAVIQGMAGQTADIMQVSANGVANPAFSVTKDGTVNFRSTSTNTSAFRIQRNGGDSIFNVDSSTNRLKIGNDTAAGGSDTSLFIVDTATTANQPTGVNGGIFYDTTLGKFRCYQAGSWYDCVTTVTTDLQTAYNNSATPALITTSSATKTLTVQAGTGFDAAGLFAVKAVSGTSVLAVNTATPNVSVGGSLTVTSSASISNGLNNNSGGITLAGAISGATTIALNSTISGGTTYTANTSMQAPLFDSASGGLNVGTSTATGITIGGANTTGTIAIGNGAANTISVGTSANAHTISIGTDATTVQTVAVGSSSGASATTIYGGTGNINLNAGKIVSNQASVDLLNTVTTTVNAFGASTAVNIGANNTVVTLGNSGAATLRSVTGALTVTAAAASTWSTAAGALTVDSASTLNLGTVNATGVSISKVGNTTTLYGTSQIGAAVGTGALLNNGSTVNIAYNMANLPTGGWDAGGAAATVDKYTYIAAGQTTTLQTLTIPAPTANTTYGRMLYLSNSGTASFTLLGTTIGAGSTATLIWTNVNGTGTWTFAGADGSGILNQNSADQTANFRISGTGRANTSFIAPAFDALAGGTVSLGTSVASGVSIGRSTTTTTNNGILQIGTSAGTGSLVNNGNTINTVCAYTGATGALTLNTAGKTPDTCTAFTITTAGATTVTVPNPTAGAGSIVYISNMSASTNTITLLGANLGIGSTATLVYNGTVWTYAGADSSGLQVAYNNSGTTDPQIQLSNTNGGLKIRDAATSTIGNLLQVADSLGTTNYLTVTSAATTVGGNILMTTNNVAVARTIQVNDQTNAATAGSQLTVKAAAGNTTGAGGNLVLVAGAGGSTGVGGIASLTGGAAGGGNTNGGAANVQGGAAAGTGTGGSVTIAGGLAASTAGSLGGTVTINGGSGSSTGNGAAGSAVNINGGNANTANGTANAGGNVNITGGTASGTAAGGMVVIQGGAASSVSGSSGGGINLTAANGTATSTGGAGGDITIKAGDATSTGVNAGGDITLTAGNATSTGVPGVVFIDTPVFTNVNQTFTQTANNQAFPAVGAETTTLQQNVDGYSTLTVNIAGAFTGATLNMPNPRNTSTGRIMYVAVANGSASFTLSASGMKSILMSQNSTAMLVWNGFAWTGNAAATSLQDVYNNTSSSPASIVTTSTTKNILFQAGVGFDNANVFQIGNSSGATIFTVDSTNTATGQNISVNGAAESTFGSEWTSHNGATITRDTTVNEFATGAASVKVATTAANHGVRNNLGAALAVSSTYIVSFSVKASDNWGNTDIAVEYYRNNTPTLDATCSAFSGTYVPTINSSSWVKYSCTFTTTATAGAATAFLAIRQTAVATRSIFIDNLSIVQQNTTGAQDVGALRVGGALGQGLNVLTLDSYAAAPFSGVNATLLGSMYYNTTEGRIQCYEQDGWGACGSAPNNSMIMVPEYGSAVLSSGTGADTHIGTMTANMCSGSSRLTIQPTEGTVCAATEEYNYYRWTSGQTTAQTYSIFAKYQLPPTFKNFYDANTITLVGRVSNTTDASVSYSLYGNTGTLCGSLTPVASAGANTWYSTPLGGAAETGCGMNPGDIITFKIDMSSRNNAYAYVSNILFTMSGK